MTVNAMLTIQRDLERGAAAWPADLAGQVAFQLGWTQSAFANVLHQIESKYGEDALLKILDNACIRPVFSSAI